MAVFAKVLTSIIIDAIIRFTLNRRAFFFSSFLTKTRMSFFILIVTILTLSNPFLAINGSFTNFKNTLGHSHAPVYAAAQRVWVTVTAYSSTPEQTDDTPFITAKGTEVRDGIIAANFLEFDTKVRIPELFGDKVFIVEDRMHRRFSDRVDIWFSDEETALRFGKQQTIIEIVES